MNTRAWLILCVVAGIAGCKPAPEGSLSDDVSPVPDSPSVESPDSDSHVLGRFTYMADAAVFEVCASGKRFPVSMEGDYIELERAYLNAGIEPGGPLTVEIQARFLERPPMEGNHNIVKVIVDSFIAISDDKSCVSSFDESLVNTYWKLIQLKGEPAALGAGQRELHMILDTEGSRVKGFSGCNRFTGAYKVSESHLQFSQIASTKMACVDGMEQEQRFLSALNGTTGFKISDNSLSLYGANGQLLLSFEAVYLK